VVFPALFLINIRMIKKEPDPKAPFGGADEKLGGQGKKEKCL
jgi:hypothetical protein